MKVLVLLHKDLREHALALLFLTAGYFFTAFVSLAQIQSGAFSMSALEVVRFTTLYILPLIAFIVGNRLIVSEYLSKTRLFVEALPVGSITPLILKYCLGLVYLSSLALMVLITAALMAQESDDVDSHFFVILLARTLAMVSLVWSIVFCFSMAGFLRLVLYSVFAAVLLLLVWMPGFDETGLGPFALMDDQLFAFERSIVPWQELMETLGLALLFTVSGFALALINEGSVAEVLAKPMSRRDFVALGIMVLAVMTVVGTLLDKSERESYVFSSEKVLRNAMPAVSILYREDAFKLRSEVLFKQIVESLSALQAELGIARLPSVRLALQPDREPYDIGLQSIDGVLVNVNYLDYDDYDSNVLQAAVVHQVFQTLSKSRMTFEPNHWLLDGFSRWWTEQLTADIDHNHQDELMARAVFAWQRLIGQPDMGQNFQLIAEASGYSSADALAYSMICYLEERAGRDVVIRLAADFLTREVGNSSIATFQEKRNPLRQRFLILTGIAWEDFQSDWREWLVGHSSDPMVNRLLSSVPAITGRVDSQRDEHGVFYLQATYSALPEYSAQQYGQCVLRHQRVSPFDAEIDVSHDDEDAGVCAISGIAHTLSDLYTAGDRVFTVLEYESANFHQPLRLWAARLNIQ